ncbi:MAG: ketoacyl-ACP synthase III [Candidatus Goldbacteria bacterium]|nr:ketoacyl-ACP synthase III [Candidatus Goldiibacteriota bacterium]
MYKAGILGTGYYLPEKVITNFDLEKIVDTTDEWIRTRTGIEQRRQAAKNEYTSDMGVKASQMAIKNAGIKIEDIDLVITATITGDYPWPSTSTIIANKLGLTDIPAFDISAACSGFIYGLKLAASLIKSGDYRNILLVASEKLSAITDWTDRNTCVLLGDGAGAVIIGRSDNGEILSTVLHSDGSKIDLLFQPGGGCVNPASEETVKNRLHYLKMNGVEIFKLAVEKMPEVLEKALMQADITPDQVDFVIFHQANIRIINSIAKRFNWPEEKNIVNIQKYGNTSAATIPIALAEAIEQGRIKKGNIIALSAFGAGLTWAGAVLRL